MDKLISYTSARELNLFEHKYRPSAPHKVSIPIRADMNFTATAFKLLNQELVPTLGDFYADLNLGLKLSISKSSGASSGQRSHCC